MPFDTGRRRFYTGKHGTAKWPKNKTWLLPDGKQPGSAKLLNGKLELILMGGFVGLPLLAGPTGLEPATSAVTGRRSNQLNYDPEIIPLVYAKLRRDARRKQWLMSRRDPFGGLLTI
jgi:hypothetical protein